MMGLPDSKLMDATRRAALPVDSQTPGNGAGKGIRINLTDFPQWPIRLPLPSKGAPAYRVAGQDDSRQAP